jgi:hypothetical protein
MAYSAAVLPTVLNVKRLGQATYTETKAVISMANVLERGPLLENPPQIKFHGRFGGTLKKTLLMLSDERGFSQHPSAPEPSAGQTQLSGPNKDFLSEQGFSLWW